VSFNLGLRFEHSGAPANLGAVRDLVLEPGEGASLAERLGGTTAVLAPSGAPLFHPGAGSLAPRAGVAVRLRRDGRSVFRAGWGLFFDRPFDNLWQTVRNNRTMLASFPYAGGVGNFLEPASSALARYRQAPFESGFPAYTLIEPDWKAGRASTWFAALSHEPARGWRTELRRRLVTTDIVNRPFSRVDGSRINSALPDVAYRGNQGASDYYALAAAAGYRGSRGLFRLAYTWAHAIDNQSDALASDFFDLTFARAGPSPDVRSAAPQPGRVRGVAATRAGGGSSLVWGLDLRPTCGDQVRFSVHGARSEHPPTQWRQHPATARRPDCALRRGEGSCGRWLPVAGRPRVRNTPGGRDWQPRSEFVRRTRDV
jgi:hypothetical protein